MKNIHLSLFVSVFLLVAGEAAHPQAGGTTDTATASEAQADAFLSQAEALLVSGDTAGEGSLAAAALELAPGYSEALYMSARLDAGNRPATHAAMDHLRTALRSATWRRTDPVAADQLLTGLLIRTGQLGEARKAAARLVALRPEDPQNSILLSSALDRAGAASAAQRTAADALRRFPLNDELRLLDARLLQRQGRSAEAAAIVRTGLLLSPASPDLLLASAGLDIDRARRIAEIDQYVASGGHDPLSAVLGMESVSVSKRRKYLDLFISQNGLSRQDLVSRAIDALRGSSDLSARLRGELARYTGDRDLDADSDGAWEDRWTFENGRIMQWIREPAQDGVAQYAAEFRDGVPGSLEVRTQTGVMRLTFSRYPSVEKAALPGEGTYSLVPFTIQCAFLRPDFAAAPPGTATPIAQRLTIPSADQLRRGAFQLVQYAPDGVTPVRRIDLAGGQRVFMEESSSGDGVFDHRVWYLHGQPQRGTRSLLHDGVFQVTEKWRDGKLAEEPVDTSGGDRLSGSAGGQ
jgi:tetratricopeptide (TPR) repeat protein